MKTQIKALTIAAALAGAALFASAPAEAGGVSISIGVPGIAFSYGSGGYCDDWGCPSGYWDYPVYYGPVFYAGQWYRGPVYYRRIHGDYWYWIHGGWHRDQWHGRRPAWWHRNRHEYHYGPALGRDYYRGHGFRHDNDRHWRQERREYHRDFREEHRDHRQEFRQERHDHNRVIRHDRREDRRDVRDNRHDDRQDRRHDRRDNRPDNHHDRHNGHNDNNHHDDHNHH